MNTRYFLALASAGLIAGSGCGFATDSIGETTTADASDTTALSLTVDIQGDTDASGFRYTIETCEGDPVLEESRELEELMLPGGLPSFVETPFDKDSAHLFSDLFTTLPAGCYNVTAQPIRDNGKKSKDCAAASAEGVVVKDKKTTEILLVSQCDGPEIGAVDILAALNHPPYIVQLQFHPSKFVSCKDTVKLCVTATDPNSDPMEIDWTQLKGPELKKDPKVVWSKQKGDTLKECIEFRPKKGGEYKFAVSVYDLFHEEAQTNNNKKKKRKGKKKYAKYYKNNDNETELVRAEEWFLSNGYGEVESHATLKFPLYVMCDKEEPPKKKKRKKRRGMKGNTSVAN